MRLILPLLLLTLLYGCQKDESMTGSDEDEAVNLTISLMTPRIEISTRGVSDDPHNKKNEWTDWQKAIDGRFIYRVSLFLVEKTTNKLVAIRDIYKDSPHITDASSEYGANAFCNNGEIDTYAKEGTEAVFTFKYDHPRHGEIEKLRRGEFRLIVVANYSDCTYNENTYTEEANSDGLKMSELIAGIKEEFDITSGKGVDNFLTNYNNFYTFKQYSSTGNLCSKVKPQILSLVKDISLHPGDNHINAELIRTYSRIRIELKNNSSSCYLRLKGLSFPDAFAQSSAYVFDDPDNPEAKYGLDKANIIPENDNAITQFIGTETTPYDIAPSTSGVIFDAYILESKNGDNGYKYKLNFELGTYSGEGNSGTFTVKTYALAPEIQNEPMTSEEIAECYTINVPDETKYIIIKNNSSGKFIQSYELDGNEYLYQGSKNIQQLSESLDNSYLWNFYDNNDNGFYIYNTGSGHCVKAPDNNTGTTSLITQYTEASRFKLTNHTNGGFHISGNSTYLNNWANNGTHLGGWDEENDKNSAFNFYKAIPGGTAETSFNENIILETIDPVTAQVFPVSAIKRNDFINILVTTSFDEMNGDLLFEVVPWGEKSGEIEFN